MYSEKEFKREKLKIGIQSPNTDALATSSDGGQNIKKILVMKADKVDIEKMYELKEDLENFATKDSVTS